MASTVEQLDLKINDETNLTKLLQGLGSQRETLVETARLRLCTPTLLDMLLHDYECGHISELISCLEKEYNGNETSIRSGIDGILKNRRDPKKLQWLFFISKSPFGQVSFFLKEDNSYIGQCRFYPPCGEKIEFTRGSNSGGIVGVPDGYAEMSIHLLDKFIGKGYGTEGLNKALDVIIKPAIGKNPLVYAGVGDKSQKPVLRPTEHRFLGLSTTTGLVNIPSIKCSLKAGLVPGRLANDDSAGSPGYIDFTFPNPTEKTEKLLQFLDAWMKETSSYHISSDKVYVTTDNGMLSHGLIPELCMLYNRLRREYSIGNPPSDEQILSYLERLNGLFQTEIHNALPSLSSDTPAVTQTNAKELVWLYYGGIEGRKLIESLPLISSKAKLYSVQ